jgi:serine/threonine protein kinase
MEESAMGDTGEGSRAGSQFGRYQLRRLLGRGGMGEVYEAWDTVKEWPVALKLMSAAYSQDPVFRKRLQREARTAGRLQEPHVVPIRDYGEIDGQLYVDMRLIDGTDLDKLLRRRGPLAPARAVAIVRQIASALDAAHAAGVMHRDVKPANILVAHDDFAYLVDFGIASAATEENLTTAGVVGTYAYMAPERFTADTEVTCRADVYALACVLHECLTGSRPYPACSIEALITAHLMQPIPRPSQARPGVPGTFDQVVARGMAKDPRDRYETAGDLALAAHDALTAADQEQADTILDRSQVASLRDTFPQSGGVVPPAEPTQNTPGATEPGPSVQGAPNPVSYPAFGDWSPWPAYAETQMPDSISGAPGGRTPGPTAPSSWGLLHRGSAGLQAGISALLIVPTLVPFYIASVRLPRLRVRWVIDVLPVELYLVAVVAIWARSNRRRLLAVAVALLGVVVERAASFPYYGSDAFAQPIWRYGIAYFSMILFVAAWGVARRRHPLWLAGLPVGAAILALLIPLTHVIPEAVAVPEVVAVGWPWSFHGSWLFNWVCDIGLFVGCCLVCWAFDVLGNRLRSRGDSGGGAGRRTPPSAAR